jgi:Fic family protein
MTSFFPSHMRQWTHPGVIVSSEINEEVLKEIGRTDVITATKEIAKSNPQAVLKLPALLKEKSRAEAEKTILTLLYKERVKRYVYMTEEGLSPPGLGDQLAYNKSLALVDQTLKVGLNNCSVKDIENLFKKIHAIFTETNAFVETKGEYRKGDIGVRRVPFMDQFNEFEAYLKKHDPLSLPFLYECKPLLDKGKSYVEMALDNLVLPQAVTFIRKYLYLPPTWCKVPLLMQNLISRVQADIKGKDPIELAASAFMEFVNIHPFVDANGRIARIFMNMILIHGGHQPIAFSYDSDYSKAVVEDQEKNNGAFAKYIQPIVLQFDYEAVPVLTKEVLQRITMKASFLD